MALIFEKSNERQDYHYYRTERLVTVQIGRSTNPGKYVWSIFHPDIRCAIWQEESISREQAGIEADEWIGHWVNPRPSE